MGALDGMEVVSELLLLLFLTKELVDMEMLITEATFYFLIGMAILFLSDFSLPSFFLPAACTRNEDWDAPPPLEARSLYCPAQ